MNIDALLGCRADVTVLDVSVNDVLALDTERRARAIVEEEAALVSHLQRRGACWRVFEPYGVRISSRSYLRDRLEGYRSVRPFSERDEAAIDAFAVIGDLRVVRWKLGVAESSRGEPLLDAEGLDAVVDARLALAPA